MIKKYLATGVTVVSLLTLPVIALAAGTDVTLTTDVSIQMSDFTVRVTGSSATLASIVVSSTNFVLNLDSGSSATVSVDGGYQIADDAASANVSSSSCAPGNSSKSYTATSAVAITVSLNGVVCSGGSGGKSSPAPVVSSGGGGGAVSTPAVTTPVVSTPVVSKPATQASPVAQKATTTLPPQASEQARSASGKLLVGISPSFTKAISYGQSNADVKRLQNLLALNLGVGVKLTGKFDNDTRSILQKFQEKYGLVKKGKAGYGSFGPATRAQFAKLYELKKPVTVTKPVVKPAPKPATSKVDIQTLLDRIKALQAQLK